MFTLEDMDLAADAEFFRFHGLDLLQVDADSDVTPDSDARLHPHTYFIAGL